MAGPFTPNPDDGAVEILRMIFGKVMDGIVAGSTATAGSEAANMLGEAFRYFNSGVLFFGSIILMWVAVFSVVNTANDGEALGKKWSTFYTPLRTMVSAASLIPTSSGYAGVQLILLLIVSWSIGFASNMWSSIVQYMVGQNVVNMAVKSVTDDPHFEELAVNALRMQVCAYATNASINAALGGGAGGTAPASAMTLEKKTTTSMNFSTQTHTTTLIYRDPKWPGSENLCGQLILSYDVPYVNDTNSKTTSQVLTSLHKAIIDLRMAYVMSLFPGQSGQPSKLSDVANAIIDAAENKLTPDAKLDSSAIAERVAQLKRLLLERVSTEVKTQVSKDNSVIAEKLSAKGWIYAGSLWSEMSRIKDAVRSATASRTQFVPPASGYEQKLVGAVLQAVNLDSQKYTVLVSEVAKKVLESPVLTKPSAPTLPKLQTNFSISDFTGGDGGYKTQFTGYFNRIGNSIVSSVVHYMAEDGVDPVTRVKNVGDTISTMAEGILVTKSLVSASLNGLDATASTSSIPGSSVAAGVIRGISTFFAEMWTLFGPSIYTLLYLGYFLGMWIPMVPFLIFALGVVGWLVFIIEMMAAGVLWAAAHTTPAREDSFIGSQTQGYLLVMSGFFRPALMVLGLVASMALLYPAVAFINEAFLLAFRSLQADSITGPLSVAGFILIYCIAIFSVFMTIFALPQSLPDRILRWIGAGIGDLGEQGTAQRIEQGASSHARTAATAAAGKQAAVDKARQDRASGNSDSSRRVASAESSAPETQLEGHGGQSTALSPMPSGESAAGGPLSTKYARKGSANPTAGHPEGQDSSSSATERPESPELANPPAGHPEGQAGSSSATERPEPPQS